MAKRTIVQLVDDTDGSEAAETLTVGLEGVNYELDLSDKNAKKLREQLAPWLAAAAGPADDKPARARPPTTSI